MMVNTVMTAAIAIGPEDNINEDHDDKSGESDFNEYLLPHTFYSLYFQKSQTPFGSAQQVLRLLLHLSLHDLSGLLSWLDCGCNPAHYRSPSAGGVKVKCQQKHEIVEVPSSAPVHVDDVYITGILRQVVSEEKHV